MKATVTADYGHLFDSNDPNYKTRYLVWYGGRGSGKSVSVARGCLYRGTINKETILCTREFQSSIKDSVIKTLAQEIQNMGLQDFYTVQSNAIYGKNGTEFIFKGVKNNVQSIKSMAGLSYIWCEEAQTMSDSSWEVLIPTLRANGSQFFVTMNPINITDPTYQRLIINRSDDIFALKVNYDRNPWFPDALKKEMEKLAKTDPEAYKHIYLGEFDTRRSGFVYAKQLAKAREENRITNVPYDSGVEVFTAWDLGYADSTAIWWLQYVGRELRWLEYYENNGEQLDHYAQVIKSKNYNYKTRGHYLPHDGGHNNIRGSSVSTQLLNMGVPNIVLEREVDINPGIEQLRQAINYSVFDAEKCKDGIHALENYGYEWDENRNVFKSTPKHDWTSHGASAARYAILAAKIFKPKVDKPVSQYDYGGRSTNWLRG